MRFRFLLLAVSAGGILLLPSGPAATTNLRLMRAPAYVRSDAPSFPRSARAAAVWGEGACWSDCQRTCTWGLTGCLAVDPQGRCLQASDTCDRSCQRDCRTRGAPYLAFGD